MVGDAADEIDGEVGSLVRDDVATEEGTEIVNNQLFERFAVEVLADEFRSMRQIAVGLGLTIHLVNDVGEILARVTEILLAQFIGQLALEECTDEETTHDSPTALIAENVPKRRNILYNLFTVIEAGVGTCSEDSSNTLMTSTKSLCSPEQIAINNNLVSIKKAIENRAKLLFHLPTHPCTIIFNFFYIIRREPLHTNLVQEFHFDNLPDFLIRLKIGVQSLCPDTRHHFVIVLQEPLGLGAPAVG